METVTFDDVKSGAAPSTPGIKVAFQDKEGRVRIGTLRVRKIYCGHEGCTKCPHKSYAYIQYRAGKKVTDKYVGVVR